MDGCATVESLTRIGAPRSMARYQTGRRNSRAEILREYLTGLSRRVKDIYFTNAGEV
jgi:hypothetical protein